MRHSLTQTETSSEAVWTVLSRHLADATQLVNCSTAAGQQPSARKRTSKMQWNYYSLRRNHALQIRRDDIA